MQCYPGLYWCARVAAAGMAAVACVPSWSALMIVLGWLTHIGLLRFSLASGARLDELTGSTYCLQICMALLLGWLARGLWMFRLWAWWLAMCGGLIIGLGCLFSGNYLWLMPLCCVVYALLVPSYSIFAEL